MADYIAFLGRHPLLSASFFGLLIAWIVYEIRQARTGYKRVPSAAATLLINRENGVFIDVNAAPDFDKGHIPGARNVPLSQFDPDGRDLSKLKGRPLVLVCRDGLSSQQAAARLVKAGYPAVHLLKGGLTGWAGDQLPLVKGRG